MTHFDATINFLKKPWVIATYIMLISASYYFVDKPVALYFNQWHLKHNIWIRSLTTLGLWELYFAIAFFLVVYFRFGTRHKPHELRAWFLLACILLANLIGLILKVVLGRARPELFFQSNLYGFYWLKCTNLYWSFPSGHAITIASIGSGLSVLFPKYFYWFMLGALLIICTRIMLVQHYLSDVVVGAYLGLLGVGVLTQYFRNNKYI